MFPAQVEVHLIGAKGLEPIGGVFPRPDFLPLHDELRNNAGTRIRQPFNVAQPELTRRIQMPNVTSVVQNVLLQSRTFQEETIRSISPTLKRLGQKDRLEFDAVREFDNTPWLQCVRCLLF